MNNIENPQIGDNEIRYTKAYLGCRSCGLPVTIVDFRKSGRPVYKCLNRGQSCFDKERNVSQRTWIPIASETNIEYRNIWDGGSMIGIPKEETKAR